MRRFPGKFLSFILKKDADVHQQLQIPLDLQCSARVRLRKQRKHWEGFFLIIQLSAQRNRQRGTITSNNTKHSVFSLASLLPAGQETLEGFLVTQRFTAKASHPGGKKDPSSGCHMFAMCYTLS